MWMYHCHILEHANTGMMGHLHVIDPAAPARLHLGVGAHAHAHARAARREQRLTTLRGLFRGLDSEHRAPGLVSQNVDEAVGPPRTSRSRWPSSVSIFS